MIGVGSPVQAADFGDGGRESDVGDRPYVGSQQGFHQVDRGRPWPDAGKSHQPSLDLVVGQVRQAVEIEPGRRDLPGQVANVARLLAAEADREQAGVVQFEKPFRGERLDGAAKRIEGGPSRGERDLLLEHDVDQRRETGRPMPQPWRPEPFDDSSQVRVAGGELADGIRERVFGEWWAG